MRTLATGRPHGGGLGVHPITGGTEPVYDPPEMRQTALLLRLKGGYERHELLHTLASV